ncbi:MAG: restriction endonuclease subunit S [Prevotella sp.]|nr:restriction endonuclease subunit S [Alistipes senegalensis]MCM1358577.1 restriction endonuclease subunit S [Prevotella sp.]MCM1473818.1 restriction endonuclease subunit S [Muribaculaceae bacterium]
MLIHRSISQLIKCIDERNTNGKITEFYGININKEFMPTVANTNGVDATKYKILKENRFVFSGMQTGRDKCIRLGLYKGNPVIISPAYTTFEISALHEVLPEYFFMIFLDNEMDRYGWFISDSSVRANLDFNRFMEIEFDLPDINVQKRYVNIYNAIQQVPKLKSKIKEICPILIQKSLIE